MVGFPEVTKSRLRKKILQYFFTNPQADLYVREAASFLREDPGNISKELASLEKSGIFNSRIRGREKFFSLNKQYPLYKELKSVVFKTIGVEGSLREIINAARGVKTAFIYGSFAENKEGTLSDIDLLIIGNPDKDSLMEKIEDLERRLQREINYNIYPEKEFKTRLKNKDGFILNIAGRQKIILKGSPDGIC